MAGVPYVFGNATTSIPLTNLDANFNTGLTIGNTTVGLGNTVTTLGNVTLTNATVSSASITDSGLTSGRAVYTGTGGLLSANANLTYDGTTFTAVNDASISGLTVGKGGGSLSTALGYQAGNTGSSNYGVMLGYQAGYSNTDVSAGNVMAGYKAGYANTSGGVTAIGAFALTANTTGASNSAFGQQALFSNTTAPNNTAVGYQAGYSNTTGIITAIGFKALYANTTGQSNTAIGTTYNYNAPLYSNTTGNNNIAVGEGALQANTTASFNAAMGILAGYSNTTGANNTCVGYGALQQNTTASNNTAVGVQALYSNTTTTDNTALGYQAGYYCTNALNVFIGKGCASNLTTGYSNTYVGTNISASAVGVNNEVVLGYGLGGKGSTTTYIAGPAYQGNNSAAWSITSDQRLKKNIVDNTDGLNKITAIQVRNFEYRTADEVTELEPQNAIDIKGVQLGAIAQELQAILPDCVKTESTGVMSVDASNLTWYLINAIKELNDKVTALENK